MNLLPLFLPLPFKGEGGVRVEAFNRVDRS